MDPLAVTSPCIYVPFRHRVFVVRHQFYSSLTKKNEAPTLIDFLLLTTSVISTSYRPMSITNILIIITL